ncbi:hypothetical protein EIP91_010140 [Steccherinum ochraceum]|uniref:Uncharacterized protein n=1 Tax=Steccherinum ochraceum TaxID=92696 RepID=A0A4R0S3R3_9APHY|nr:hypothetical protein EIP91_010140 [Steccherinum ochraceum]
MGEHTKELTLYASTADSHRLLVLTVTPRDQTELFINHTPLAWKVFDFPAHTDIGYTVAWNSDSIFSLTGRNIYSTPVPNGTSAVLKASGGGGVHWTTTPGRPNRIIARHETATPQTFILGSSNKDGDFEGFVQFTPTTTDAGVVTEPATMLQVYVVTGYKPGDLLRRQDSESYVLRSDDGAPQPLDLTTQPQKFRMKVFTEASGRAAIVVDAFSELHGDHRRVEDGAGTSGTDPSPMRLNFRSRDDEDRRSPRSSGTTPTHGLSTSEEDKRLELTTPVRRSSSFSSITEELISGSTASDESERTPSLRQKPQEISALQDSVVKLQKDLQDLREHVSDKVDKEMEATSKSIKDLGSQLRDKAGFNDVVRLHKEIGGGGKGTPAADTGNGDPELTNTKDRVEEISKTLLELSKAHETVQPEVAQRVANLEKTVGALTAKVETLQSSSAPQIGRAGGNVSSLAHSNIVSSRVQSYDIPHAAEAGCWNGITLLLCGLRRSGAKSEKKLSV